MQHRKTFSHPQNYPGANNEYAEKIRSDNDYDSDPIPCPPHTSTRKLVAKIDLHVLPCLCITYLLCFLDRVNISNANVYGLSRDLGFVGPHASRFNVALVIFFVPYILFEIPGNILLKKFKPQVWLPACTLLFGFTTIMQGIVTNYAGLLACRFFLGLFEASIFPGCFYVIGMWYRRPEAQKRYTFFFSSTSLAGAFGGLLAAAIGKMDGLANYAAWRWVFIIEGAATVFFALIFFFTIPNFPEESSWLTPDEKAFVTARLQQDQGTSARDRPIAFKDIINVLTDYKVIAAGFAYFGLIVPAYSYAYFSPSIIKGFGFSPIQTQLHSVPPWAAAFGFAMLVASISDGVRHRFAFAITTICISITGLAALLSIHHRTNVQYGLLFLVTCGTYSAMPIVVCWFNMNLGGHHRRAIGSAWQIGFGNIGGIIATWSFTDPPLYERGYGICIGFACLSIVACVVYGAGCYWANRRKERAPANLGLSAYERTELGDLSPEYRYLL